MRSTKFLKLAENQKGQGLVEYMVLVGLIGVACFLMVKTVGQALTTHYGDIANALGAEVTVTNKVADLKASVTEKTMRNFAREAVEEVARKKK